MGKIINTPNPVVGQILEVPGGKSFPGFLVDFYLFEIGGNYLAHQFKEEFLSTLGEPIAGGGEDWTLERYTDPLNQAGLYVLPSDLVITTGQWNALKAHAEVANFRFVRFQKLNEAQVNNRMLGARVYTNRDKQANIVITVGPKQVGAGGAVQIHTTKHSIDPGKCITWPALYSVYYDLIFQSQRMAAAKAAEQQPEVDTSSHKAD